MDQLNIIKDKICSLGRKFVGATEQRYPTYMVHLDFLKPNDDPMYPIDRAIIHFVKDMPKVDKTSVAKIIGMEPNLIDYRIKKLCESGDLEYSQNYGQYQITSKGEKDYFAPDGSVMYVYSSKDLLIDGNSLSIMDEKIYSVRSRIESGSNSDIIENVTITKDGKPMRKLLKQLEGMTNTNKEKLRIPADSKSFDTSDEPSFGNIRIYFVFSIDGEGKVCKEIFYNDDFIKIPFYSNNIHKYFYGRKINFNYGFTGYEDKDVKNKIFDFTNETICSILKDLYQWKSIDESYYVYKSDSYGNDRPLIITLNLKSFLKSGEKKKLKEDLKNGEVDYQIKDSVITLSVVSNDPALNKLLQFEEDVDNYHVNKGLDFLIDWLCATDLINNRKKLISLDRFDILEEIDNKLFIQNN